LKNIGNFPVRVRIAQKLFSNVNLDFPFALVAVTTVIPSICDLLTIPQNRGGLGSLVGIYIISMIIIRKKRIRRIKQQGNAED